MRDFNSLEDIIGAAARGGWEWFDQVTPDVKQAIETRRNLADEERKAVARAWADFYKSPGGRKALEHLFDATLRRTVFFVQLGLAVEQFAFWGAFREGQNSLAHEIARQIAEGLGEDGPPPRDA